MDYLTQYYKNRSIQLQEQIYNLNKLLLEVNSDEHNGTGGTQPPTVIYFDVTRSPKDNPDNFRTNANDENTDDGRDYFTDWINQQIEYMRQFGATPEDIARLVRLLRQQYLLYRSGSQGSISDAEINRRIAEYFMKILKEQQFYKDYFQNQKFRKKVNDGIDGINRYIPPNYPGIPNIDPLPWSVQ
jgi:hypothetical protein